MKLSKEQLALLESVPLDTLVNEAKRRKRIQTLERGIATARLGIEARNDKIGVWEHEIKMLKGIK